VNLYWQTQAYLQSSGSQSLGSSGSYDLPNPARTSEEDWMSAEEDSARELTMAPLLIKQLGSLINSAEDDSIPLRIEIFRDEFC
jgi:hypothetical protein